MLLFSGEKLIELTNEIGIVEQEIALFEIKLNQLLESIPSLKSEESLMIQDSLNFHQQKSINLHLLCRIWRISERVNQKPLA